MALTDDCDIYLAVHDLGVNRVINHLWRQRPSMFNYATAHVVRNPDLLCERIDAHPVVAERGNPLVTITAPFPVFGSVPSLAVNYSIQVRKPAIDFSPGGAFTLPPELDPLGAQRLAITVGACVGYGCPDPKLLGLIPSRGIEAPSAEVFSGKEFENRRRAGRPEAPKADILLPPRDRPTPLPVDELLCTCLDVHAVAGVDFVGPSGDQRINPALTGIELVDLGPESLENSIECYAELLVRYSVFPRVRIPAIKFTIDLLGLAVIDFEPTLSSAAVPNNPALEDDQIKVFVDLAASAGSGSAGGGDGGGGGGESESFPGVTRARVRSGTHDAQVALGEPAVDRVFGVIRDGFRFEAADSADFGPFTAGYEVDIHLENGDIDLRSDGSIALEELDVVFDELGVYVGIDIPELCIGGFCIIPTPFGCALRAPEICVFSADPDLALGLNLGGLLRSEISARLEPVVKHSTNPGRTAAMNDWDALDVGVPNHWQLYVDPITIDLDLIDFADIVGDLLEDALDAVLDTILGPLPGWAKDLIRAILGPVIDLVRDILDLGDDVEEWLSDLLGVSFGLFDIILTVVADYFASDTPIVEFEDPLTMLPPAGGLIPVLLPIEHVGVDVDETELTLSVDIGD